MTNDPLASSLDYTLAHLARLDLLIRSEVIRVRRQQPAADEFRGLYISEEEVDALLDRSLTAAGLIARPVDPGEPAELLDQAIDAVDAQIADLDRRADEGREIPRLARVGRLFGLSRLERWILVIALAAELDLKYERLYAYLQDDVTKKRPTVDLALRLLCPTLADRVRARGVFEPHAPLLRWELIGLTEDPGSRQPVLLARYLKLDDRIAGYLLGSDAPDPRLAPLLTPLPEGPALTQDVRDRLDRLAQVWAGGRGEGALPIRASEPGPVFHFHGRYGSGRRVAAAHLARAIGRPLLLLDLAAVPAEPDEIAHRQRRAEREAILTGAMLGWDRADTYLQSGVEREAAGQAFLRALANGRAPTVLIGEGPWESGRTLERRPFLRLALPETTYADRRAIWSGGLQGSDGSLSDHEINALTGRFRLSAGQIEDALRQARALARLRDPLNGHPTLDEIDAACRSQAQHRLGSLARKLAPRYTWDDIVLPATELNTLHLISSMIRQRSVVYGEWGFDRKLAMGKGVIALFAGPSGTGKTMAVEVIARDLGLDVYRIDLSAVVNKYIGETEKNLDRLFSEAQDTDAILFFDEADALFGKRSGVSDAHDRYANIETAYLLQRTEEYNGLVILASNLPKNVDEAFTRRLHFTISFREPDEAERLEIWRRTFPAEAPVADDIDLPFLARKFKITGGNIRNIILAAAFLAAEEGQPISMRHLIASVGQEYQKLGKLLLESDFGRYLSQARV